MPKSLRGNYKGTFFLHNLGRCFQGWRLIVSLKISQHFILKRKSCFMPDQRTISWYFLLDRFKRNDLWNKCHYRRSSTGSRCVLSYVYLDVWDIQWVSLRDYLEISPKCLRRILWVKSKCYVQVKDLWLMTGSKSTE